MNTTIDGLVDKGLVEEVTNDKGETGFVLSKQLTNGKKELWMNYDSKGFCL